MSQGSLFALGLTVSCRNNGLLIFQPAEPWYGSITESLSLLRFPGLVGGLLSCCSGATLWTGLSAFWAYLTGHTGTQAVDRTAEQRMLVSIMKQFSRGRLLLRFCLNSVPLRDNRKLLACLSYISCMGSTTGAAAITNVNTQYHKSLQRLKATYVFCTALDIPIAPSFCKSSLDHYPLVEDVEHLSTLKAFCHTHINIDRMCILFSFTGCSQGSC